MIRTLVAPAKVSEILFSDIVDKAKAHFNPKPSPIVKRFEFTTRCQREDESVSVYVAELKKLVEYCEYGTALSDMLRDRICVESVPELFSVVFYSNPTLPSTRHWR